MPALLKADVNGKRRHVCWVTKGDITTSPSGLAKQT
jgi:hypothetical protein